MKVCRIHMKFAFAATLLATVGCGFADDELRTGFAERLPPGSVRPHGWLLRQMELQRDGLTGHAERLYHDIGQSDWLTQAGRGGEFAWERGPYYAKGLVSLAFALNDAGLKKKAERWVDAIVASQRENGDFGPKNRNWWANMIALWLLRDWQEATGDMRIVPFLERYFDYQRTEFATYPLPAESKWAQARAGDELDVVLWLYRKTKVCKWLDLARSIASQSADWATYYRHGGDGAKDGYRSHIVNFMQGLKTPALRWLLDGDEANRTAYSAAFSSDGWLMRRCGRPDRMLNGSEPLSDRSASGGTELCAIAERILSSHVQLSVFGDAEVADDLEMVAYNSLPATLSGDCRGMRYYLMLNQPSCIDKALLFANNGFGAQVTGATCAGPHSGFGCCRSNFHMAWPKFAEAMWMAREGGLVAVAYGDCTVSTPIATIAESGGYPFSDCVSLTVEKTQGATWPLFVRIPRWCSAPQVRVNGGLCQTDAIGGFRKIVRTWRVGDRVTLHFPSLPVASFWANDAVCIRRGALLYALPVEGRTRSLTQYQVPYEKRKTGERESGFPRREIQATTPWNYALVMQPSSRKPMMETTGTGESLRIRVRAVQTACGGWGSMRADAPGRPEDPPPSPVSAHYGCPQWLTLAPIGLTQTRIALFPWIESPADGKTTVTPQQPQTVASLAAGGRLWDFGKDAFGWLEIESANGGTFDLTMGELTNAYGCVTNEYPRSTIRAVRVSGVARPGRHRVELKPDFRNTHGPDESPAIRLDPALGTVMPFRYVQEAVLPSGARLVRHAVHWPIDMSAASFVCDSAALNRVWEFCKYSIWATSFAGLYVDGDRERIPYEADAYINQLGHYAIDADYLMGRRTHEYLLRFPTWPTEWKQHSIKMAWADWMWSGDAESIRRYYGLLKEKKLRAGFPVREDGLVVSSGIAKNGDRDIVDWPPAERDGFEFTKVNSVINAFHYRNLLEMADMAQALGKVQEAVSFRSEAERVRLSYNGAFYDGLRGVYLDGEGCRNASIHANAAALAFGLVPSERIEPVVRHLDSKGMACSVYFAQYLLEAYCIAGRADLALKYMTATGERSWIGMMDFGSSITLEAWNMKAKPNQDMNHAWGSAPLNVISRFILGVTPLEPGFRRISIAPQPGGLRWVDARVPTAAGTVHVNIAGDRLVVETPAPANVVWGGKTHSVNAGRHAFGE
ncbi:MAG: glycoside hydrolase family 127 protein [Kiritimatiellae bacterium]|nr:glycoside hydrolase family 127 protein [Kiritimatiellia bacterium]